jgi:hypothetical protein
MNDHERQELATRYSSLTDDSLLAALTGERHQYRPEVLPLLEDEAQKRNLSAPATPAVEKLTAETRSGHASLASLVSKRLTRLHWKRLTWVGRGYMVILGMMILPFLGACLIYAVAAIFGCELVGHYLETGGEVPPCLIMGVNISPPLHVAYAILGWWAIISVLTGPGLILCFTVLVALKWCWKRCFDRS